MPSAWADAFGSSWGDAWGTITAVITGNGNDQIRARRARIRAREIRDTLTHTEIINDVALAVVADAAENLTVISDWSSGYLVEYASSARLASARLDCQLDGDYMAEISAAVELIIGRQEDEFILMYMMDM